MNVSESMDPEQQSWPLQPVLTALAAIALLLLFAVTKRSKGQWPPGPTAWPVLGNLHLLGTLPHQSLAKLATKYGPLMTIKLGSVKLLVASSPAMAEEILKTQDRIWSSRHATAAAKIMCYGGLDIAFSEYGPRWRYAKKIFLLELFTAKRVSEFQKTRKEEIMSGINDTIRGCCNGTKALRIDMVLRKIAMNVMTRMLMNQNVHSEKGDQYAMKDTDDFQETIKEAFRLFGAFYLGDFIPWLDRLDPQGLKKQMYACAKKYDKFLQSVLDDHKVKLELAKQRPEGSTDETPQDIVDTLLTRPRDGDGQYLTELEMKAIMQDVILAGIDTNSSVLEWGLSELMRNPQCMEKAQAELDSVVGRDRLVEESDLPNLPYLNAIVKENFRLHPSAALTVPHVSTEDCEILGYKIPAKTRVMINAYAIQRDPAVWDRALEFDPERFLGSTKDVHGMDFDLIPFGSGRRICPGKGHAILVVQYTMALFIQTCNWRLPGNMRPEQLDMDEVCGVTVPRLNPLQAIATPRLPEHVLRDYEN